jgi:hypothetical protein
MEVRRAQPDHLCLSRPSFVGNVSAALPMPSDNRSNLLIEQIGSSHTLAPAPDRFRTNMADIAEEMRT